MCKRFCQCKDKPSLAYGNFKVSLNIPASLAFPPRLSPCHKHGESAALFGFFGLPSALRASHRDHLEAWTVQQLARLFGAEAAHPLQAIIQDWSAETFTATRHDQMPPASHPAYGHRPLRLDHWQDKLYFCGTETAQTHGGYLEGALEASERVFTALTL